MKLLYLTLFGFFVTTIVALPSDLEEWNAFKLKYGKNYANATEEKKRMEIFLNNKHKVEEHNEKHAKGSVTYKMGLNKFSDLSTEEVNVQMNGLRPNLLTSTHVGNRTTEDFVGSRHHHHHHHRHHHHRHHHRHRHHHQHQNISSEHPNVSTVHPNVNTVHPNVSTQHLPVSIDWRHEGAVNEGKSQGNCGSCWAFSTVGAIEGQYFRKTGKLIRLSEQNLVDCVYQIAPTCGCSGCTLPTAYQYVQLNGINTAADYPTRYIAKDGLCKSNISTAFLIMDFNVLPMGNEHNLHDAIATIGPISVSMDASHSSFHHYSSGVYYEPDCSQDDTNHAALVVGYGSTDAGEDYYIVKNSWGEDWGEKGYFKLARNRNNHCGIATGALYPLL